MRDIGLELAAALELAEAFPARHAPTLEYPVFPPRLDADELASGGMDADALEAVAGRLFDAFVAHDLDTAGSLFAPDALIVQNGVQMTWAVARPMIAGFRDVLGDHHYTEVRRVTGDQVVVEEHHVVSTTPDGRDVDLPACVVIRVDADGLITRVDEYVDTAPLLS